MEKIGKDLWAKFDRVEGDAEVLENDYWQQLLNHPQCPQALKSVQASTLLAMTEDFIRAVDQQESTHLLEWLVDEGIHLGICSNNNEFWYRRQMRKLGFYRFFCESNVTLSCHHGITKKDHRIFQIAAHSLGLHPTECVFIDDRMGNVTRSVECGMTGIFFPTEQFPDKPQRGAKYLGRLLSGILK